MGNWIGKQKFNEYCSRGGDKTSIVENQHCGNQQESIRYENPRSKSSKSTPPCIQLNTKEDVLPTVPRPSPPPDPRSPTAGIIRTPAQAENDNLQNTRVIPDFKLLDSSFSFDSVEKNRGDANIEDGKEVSLQEDSLSKDKESTTNLKKFRRSLRKFSSSMSRRHRFQYSSLRNNRGFQSDQFILTSDDENPRGIGFHD